MDESKTRHDTIIAWIKDNRVLACVTVLGTAIVALAAVTGAVRNLLTVFSREPETVDIGGEWVSDVQTDYIGDHACRLFFTFRVEESSLLGTVREKSSGPGRIDIINGILDGQITGDNVSFYVYKRDVYSDVILPKIRVTYHGRVSGDQILFTRQDDQGTPIRNITATRRGGTPLHKAVSEARAETVKRLLGRNANPNSKDGYESTPLHKAVELRQGILQEERNRAEELGRLLDIVELLVKNGAEVDTLDIHGDTPLRKALLTSHPDLQVATVLLSHRANPNVRSDGRTLLHVAVNKRQLEVARLLLEAGADPNVTDDEGDTALHEAVSKGNTKILELLLEAGADLEARGRYGRTPLHVALDEHRVRIAGRLLKAGAMVNVETSYGCTPLHLAVLRGEEELVPLLLESGAAPNVKDDGGDAPLYAAAWTGHVMVAKLLLEAGAEANAKDDQGYTALHRAASKAKAEIVKLLLEAGADANARDNDGETPLHAAAHTSGYEAAKVVALLISRGADVNLKNTKLETALAIALREGSDVVNLLRSGGDEEEMPGDRSEVENPGGRR